MTRRARGISFTTRGRVLTIAVAFFGSMLLLWLVGSLVAAPNGSRVAAPAAPGQVVQLATPDGVAIEANYWPTASDEAPAVLLLHGIDASRAAFDAHALWLNGLGYAVLAPDFRGHGGSAARARTFGWREAEDAAAAFAFLRTRAPGRKIAVIGISMGGAAALLGRNGPLPADALILQAVYPDLRTAITNRIAIRGGRIAAGVLEPLLSYQSWPRYGVAPNRIAPIAGMRRYAGPVLIIGGTGDGETPEADTRALHAAAAGDKSLWLVEGLSHVETCSLWTAEYREHVGRFLKRTIGKPA